MASPKSTSKRGAFCGASSNNGMPVIICLCLHFSKPLYPLLNILSAIISKRKKKAIINGNREKGEMS